MSTQLKRHFLAPIFAFALVLTQFAMPVGAQGLRSELQSLWRRTLSLYDQGRYAEAERTAKQSIAIASSQLGPRHKATARGGFELARVITRLGRTEEAEKLTRQAVSVWTAEFGPRSAEVSSALTLLGVVLFEQDRYAESHEALARALTNLDVSKPLRPFHRGQILRWQGLAYWRQGKLSEAEAKFRQSLAALERMTGNDRIFLHRVEANIGHFMWQRGFFSEGEQYFKRAAAGYEQLGQPARSEFAGLLARMGSFYVSQDRHTDAEALLRRSLALNQLTSGADSPLTAATLDQQGRLELERGRHAEAEVLLRRALDIYRRTRGEEHVLTAAVMVVLGDAMVRNGKLDDAEQLVKRGLALREQKLGPDHAALSYDHFIQGTLHLARNDFPRSLTAMERGMAIIRNALGDSHPAMARGLRWLATAHRQAGRDAEAFALLRKASDVAHLRHAITDNPAFDNPTSEIGPRIRRAINAQIIEHAAPGTAGPIPEAERREVAFIAAQRGRDTSAATAVAQMAARFGAQNDELAQLVRRTQDLSHNRNRLDRLLVATLGEGSDESDLYSKRDRREILAERMSISDDLTAVVQTLQNKYPNYLQLLGQPPLSIKQTQALLSAGEALVAFHVGQAATTVWAITHNQVAWHNAPLGTLQLGDAVDKIRCGLEVDAWADERRRERCKSLGLSLSAPRLPFDMGAAHDLYAKLLGPLESVIAGSNLFLVPAGPLTALPFHVLLTARPSSPGMGSPEEIAGAPWLVRRHAMTVMPSVQSLSLLRTAPSSNAPNAFIGYGAPVFSRELPRLPGGNRALTGLNSRPRPGAKTANVPLDGAGIATLRLGLKDLPETRHELEFIGAQLQAPARDIVLGAQANEAAIKKAPLETYRIVYFATHALIQGEVAGLSEPALAFTLPDQPTDADDGLLTASEIARLELNADWVVLSACNTAAGQSEGSEALSGLARAFFYAGTRSLLVSHWKVDSDAAVKLTTATFAVMASLPTISRGQALRHAMLVLADSTNADESHPSYWAPFFVVGDSSSHTNTRGPDSVRSTDHQQSNKP